MTANIYIDNNEYITKTNYVAFDLTLCRSYWLSASRPEEIADKFGKPVWDNKAGIMHFPRR